MLDQGKQRHNLQHGRESASSLSLPIGCRARLDHTSNGEQRAITVLRSLVERKDKQKFGTIWHFIDSGTGGLARIAAKQRTDRIERQHCGPALYKPERLTAAPTSTAKLARLAKRKCRGADWRAMFDRGKAGYLSMGGARSTDRRRWPGKIP